jgi:glycosyltransferase involved in cell wall biosynthesis
VPPSPLTVGFNLIFMVPGRTGGMEVYARELLGAIAELAPEDTRFVSFVNREAAGAPGPWRDLGPTLVVPVRAMRRVEWVRGEQQLLPRMAARAGVDLLHSLGSTAPGWGRFARIVTVHDLVYLHEPRAHAGLLSLGMRVLVPLAVRRSARVIADSHATKRDLVELLRTPAQRVDVVPLGIGGLARAQPLGEAELRERFALGDRRVLLSLSAKRAHKNLTALLEACALLDERPVVILAGYRTAHERELRARAAALGLADDVRWPEWLEPAEVEGLWRLTAGLVYPSLYEGFGLPVLEAMARGVAVACADVASLPEVAGDAALLFDPRDRRAIADAIAALLAGGPAIDALREAGRRRAATFTWERTASLTLASYSRAAAAGP